MHLDKRKLLGVFFHNLLSPLHLFYSLCSSLKTRLPFRDFAFAVPLLALMLPEVTTGLLTFLRDPLKCYQQGLSQSHYIVMNYSPLILLYSSVELITT